MAMYCVGTSLAYFSVCTECDSIKKVRNRWKCSFITLLYLLQVKEGSCDKEAWYQAENQVRPLLHYSTLSFI